MSRTAERTASVLAGMLVLVFGGPGAWAAETGAAPPTSPPVGPDPYVLLGRGPWPGMMSLDVVWCKELVYAAQVVEIREPGKKPRLVWVRDARGWLKPNGFFGLKLNGEPVDEGTVWLNYAGAMMNLRALFTYGSVPLDPSVPVFRD